AVDADGHQPLRARLEDRRTKRTARLPAHVRRGEIDRNTHLRLVGRIDAVPVDDLVDPIGQADDNVLVRVPHANTFRDSDTTSESVGPVSKTRTNHIEYGS